jgi:hypothetical protein
MIFGVLILVQRMLRSLKKRQQEQQQEQDHQHPQADNQGEVAHRVVRRFTILGFSLLAKLGGLTSARDWSATGPTSGRQPWQAPTRSGQSRKALAGDQAALTPTITVAPATHASPMTGTAILRCRGRNSQVCLQAKTTARCFGRQSFASVSPLRSQR